MTQPSQPMTPLLLRHPLLLLQASLAPCCLTGLLHVSQTCLVCFCLWGFPMTASLPRMAFPQMPIKSAPPPPPGLHSSVTCPVRPPPVTFSKLAAPYYLWSPSPSPTSQHFFFLWYVSPSIRLSILPLDFICCLSSPPLSCIYNLCSLMALISVLFSSVPRTVSDHSCSVDFCWMKE